MSGDIFLKLDGVKGESQKDGHKDEMEVETFSWGESNPTSFAQGGGGGVGKVSIQDVHFTKAIDKASVNLYQFCANGKHIKDAVFTFRKAGETPQDYLKVTLNDVMVSSVSLQDHSGGAQLANDSVSLAYAKVKMEYAAQSAKGDVGGSLPFGWDIAEHKPAQ